MSYNYMLFQFLIIYGRQHVVQLFYELLTTCCRVRLPEGQRVNFQLVEDLADSPYGA